MPYGLIQVFTGDGKGKTTAALGEVMRTVGVGKKAAVVFFDKGGKHYSERSALDRLDVDWLAYGRDRIDPKTGRFDFSIMDEDRAEAQRALEVARTFIQAGRHDLVVLDEINTTAALGMIDVTDALSLIDQKPDNVELVLTGRNAPAEFLERAHLVTEIVMRKHYFYSSVKAREGLDY